jgi:hypothetical protein
LKNVVNSTFVNNPKIDSFGIVEKKIVVTIGDPS